MGRPHRDEDHARLGRLKGKTLAKAATRKGRRPLPIMAPDTSHIDSGWSDPRDALVAEMAQALYDACGCCGIEPMVRLLAYAEGRVPLADGSLLLSSEDIEILSEELTEADWVEVPRPALPVALRNDELIDVVLIDAPPRRIVRRRRLVTRCTFDGESLGHSYWHGLWHQRCTDLTAQYAYAVTISHTIYSKNKHHDLC